MKHFASVKKFHCPFYTQQNKIVIFGYQFIFSKIVAMKKTQDLPIGTVFIITICKNLFFIIVFLQLIGCGFQSRKYTTGQFWDGHNEINCATKKQRENQNDNEKQSEIQNEKKSAQKQWDTSEDGKGLSSIERTESSVEKREFVALSKDRSITKWKDKKRAEFISKTAEGDPLKKEKDPEEKEKKIRRSTNGFMTFWSIESLFYLGLLYNTYSPDVWGFFLVIFGFFTVLLMIPTLIYLLVMNVRYHRSKESIQDEKIKKRTPKWSRIFAMVMLAEVIMLFLALMMSGNF